MASKPNGVELLVNTLANNSNNKNGAKFEISIEFRKGAVQPKDLNINQLDVFVISKEADTKTKRIEIHVAGHAPTDLGNTKLFGQGNDQSSVEEKRYYLSSENLAWGVVIPTDFAWPLEYKRIAEHWKKTGIPIRSGLWRGCVLSEKKPVFI